MPRPFVDDIFASPRGPNGEGGQGEWIDIYTGQEVIQDPTEGNTRVVYNNPLPIKAIVTDLTADQIAWKMPGIVSAKAKELFVKDKYRSLIEQSQKINVKGEDYEGFKVNGKMQIRQMAKNVLRVYVYLRVA